MIYICWEETLDNEAIYYHIILSQDLVNNLKQLSINLSSLRLLPEVLFCQVIVLLQSLCFVINR